MNIQMVDLNGQYKKIKEEIDSAIQSVLNDTDFIKGQQVTQFEKSLSEFLSVKHVISCANGTDALQIALMALPLNKGDEIIIPAFTYIATAEAIALLGLTPVLVDVEDSYFGIDSSKIESAITSKTKAIIPVHLFGQSTNMQEIMSIAKKYHLFVIEDNAQAIGSEYTFSNGCMNKLGTIGDIGCTSFFPSKNLGCYGDGGAIMTNNDLLAEKIKMIANHGQKIKYHHDIVGCNSRLDTLQASILNVKLKYLDTYNLKRLSSAQIYNEMLKNCEEIIIPQTNPCSTHVYHQYTLIVKNGKRDLLKDYLSSCEIPSMVYYPLPLHKQKAYENIVEIRSTLDNSSYLSNSVLSLPMHTELTLDQINHITNSILNYLTI